MDKLWDISECRKSQADEERQRIAEERWLEDHIGLLSNHYISIMQVQPHSIAWCLEFLVCCQSASSGGILVIMSTILVGGVGQIP